MRLKSFIVVLLSLYCACPVFAQLPGGSPQPRILILFDESSSMLLKWPSGKEKYKAADELILKIMDSVYAVDPNVEFSLRVFGHQSPMQEKNCYDTKNEVAFAKENRTQMSFRLDDIRPRGVTPIAYALREAAKYDLVDEIHNVYSIILITDGGESCGGDICDVMRQLMQSKVYFKPYIISLEDDPSLKVTYACMGEYLQVTKQSDMMPAVGTIVNAFRPIMNITPAAYKKMQTVAAAAPSVLKVNIPVMKMDTTPVKPQPKLDTIKAIAEPPKVHAIKVDEPWIKPVALQLPVLVPGHLKLVNEYMPKPTKLKEVALVPMPELKAEIPPVVRTPETVSRLVPARPVPLFTAPATTTRLKQMQNIAPPEIAVEVPAFTHTIETINHLTAAKLVAPAIPVARLSKFQPMTVPEMPAIINEPLPFTHTAETVNRMSPAKMILATVATPKPARLRTMTVPELPEIKNEAPVFTHATETIAQLAPARVIAATTAAPKAAKLRTITVAEMPEIKNEVPAFTHTTESVAQVPPARLISILVPAPPIRFKKVKTIDAPEIVNELPPLPAPTAISRIAAAKQLTVRVDDPAPLKIKEIRRNIPFPELVIDRPTLPAPTAITKLKPSGLRQLGVIIVFDEPKMRAVPPMPPIKAEPVVAAAPPKPAPAKPGKPTKPEGPADKKVDYKVEVEDARETTVEVYFTDGHGKFYTTTPSILLMNPGSPAVVKKFYRTVDEAGNPDPKTNIPVGVYDVAVSEKKSLLIRNVEIKQNKKNKIVFTVNKSSIKFKYADPLRPGENSDRPVSEFSAMVIERNKAQGRVQQQKCTEILEYEPGNYHIEINTFPTTLRNIDVDFDVSLITIPQPGFAKFTGLDPKIHGVTLYQRLGDKFLSFFPLDLNNPASKHLQMMPGEYQVHYQKGPANMRAPEKVVMFLVKSTEEVEIKLE